MKTIFERSLSAHERALASGEYSAEELCRAFLDRIEETDRELGAFLTVAKDQAIQAARASDVRRRAKQPLHALDGIPFAVKDNFCTNGIPTTCAGRMLEGYLPPYDATVVERMRSCGGVLLGKLNMDEFGMGSSTEHSAYRITRNPIDPTRVPGGSSGGAAAAVAAGEAPFAIASDTGGSVRQPAAFCGVLGLKPTYGALSRYGMVAFASSLDCVGLITRSADDCARVFSALLGKDAHDATSLAYAASDLDFDENMLKSLRLGVVDMQLESRTVSNAVSQAVAALCERGAVASSAELPTPMEALAAYYVISSAEASSNLARFDGIRYGKRSAQADTLSELYENSRREGFGAEVKRRILFGTYVLSVGNREDYYLRACEVREKIRRTMAKQFEGCDLLILPVTPTPAFRIGEYRTPKQMYEADLCTVYASLAGYPAISVPFGKTADGLPLAVQLIAPPMCEGRLLSVARLLEEVEV